MTKMTSVCMTLWSIIAHEEVVRGVYIEIAVQEAFTRATIGSLINQCLANRLVS